MSNAIPSLRPGTLLLGGSGTYKIEGILGTGTFSIVYRASSVSDDTHKNVPVAIKELFVSEINFRENEVVITDEKNLEEMQCHIQHFKTEAINLSSLDTEGVVGFIEDFEANGTYYNVMEMADGISLEKYANTNKVSETDALRIMSKLTKSVWYLHEKARLLHLDIKPSNIILCGPDLNPVLLDFGLSCHVDANCDDTLRLSRRGTPGYASYEQYHYSIGDVMTAGMDIYALGATLYKMVTGYTPPTADEIADNPGILENSLARNGVSERICNVILKSMGSHKSQRFKTVDGMLSQIGKVLDSIPSDGKHNERYSVFNKSHWHEVKTVYLSIPMNEPSGKFHLQECIISRGEMDMLIDHIHRDTRRSVISDKKFYEILEFISDLSLPAVSDKGNVLSLYRLEVNLESGESFIRNFGEEEDNKSLYISLLGMFHSLYALNMTNMGTGTGNKRRLSRVRVILLAISVVILLCSSYSGLMPLHLPVLGEHVAMISGFIFAVVWFLASQYWESHSRNNLCRFFFYISATFAIALSISVFFLQRPMALPIWSLASCFTLITALSLQIGDSE